MAGLQRLSGESCLVYLNDVIVLGRSCNEHLKNLQAVFAKLKAANLKLNSKKCCRSREDRSSEELASP